MIATYLINLDGSDARLASARADLSAAGIAFERVPAFDGRGVDPATLPDYDPKATMAYMGRPLRGGEIGCYYSHLDCARRFLESGAPYGLVLEDDMKLVPEAAARLRDMLAWLEAHRIDWDVINVGANRLKFTTPLAEFAGHRLVRAHYFPMTTTGILWSRSGARAFVEGHRGMFAPVDNFLREWQCVADRGLSVSPPLVTTTGAVSDIDGGTAKRKADGRSGFYGWLKQKRVWRNKLRALRHQRRWQAGTDRARG